jgi:hypothetical protein
MTYELVRYVKEMVKVCLQGSIPARSYCTGCFVVVCLYNCYLLDVFCFCYVPINCCMILNLFVFFHFFGLYILLSILCFLSFCIFFCLLFLPVYLVVYFLFVYNFTDHCHRVETKLQLINIHIIS